MKRFSNRKEAENHLNGKRDEFLKTSKHVFAKIWSGMDDNKKEILILVEEDAEGEPVKNIETVHYDW